MEGSKLVHVEMDHQMIVRKPLNTAPKCLQQMLLRLQRYSVDVNYKKGSHVYLSDTLSHAYLPEANACTVSQELAEVDHTLSLALTPERLQHAVPANDTVLQELQKIIQQRWPDGKSSLQPVLHACYDFRDELTIQDQLVFKGPIVIAPVALRREMMATCHATLE